MPAAGDFDTQFTFAQTLTEAAAAVDDVLVLIAIPSSDIETGGERGQTALRRLKNVVSRVAMQWQPASADETFEIVRRRLFEPIPPDKLRIRDAVVRAFSDLYQSDKSSFAAETREGEYRRRMEAAYPIHPEFFDRLYEDLVDTGQVPADAGCIASDGDGNQQALAKRGRQSSYHARHATHARERGGFRAGEQVPGGSLGADC